MEESWLFSKRYLDEASLERAKTMMSASSVIVPSSNWELHKFFVLTATLIWNKERKKRVVGIDSKGPALVSVTGPLVREREKGERWVGLQRIGL